MKPLYFASPAEWRRWLEEHHGDTPELLVGFYKIGSGQPSITWPESVDHALCFGWIDGVRRSIDEKRYVIRFTPRSSGSVWSAVNIRRVKELAKAALMHPAGLKAATTLVSSNHELVGDERQEGGDPAPEAERPHHRLGEWRGGQTPQTAMICVGSLVSP